MIFDLDLPSVIKLCQMEIKAEKGSAKYMSDQYFICSWLDIVNRLKGKMHLLIQCIESTICKYHKVISYTFVSFSLEIISFYVFFLLLLLCKRMRENNVKRRSRWSLRRMKLNEGDEKIVTLMNYERSASCDKYICIRCLNKLLNQF